VNYPFKPFTNLNNASKNIISSDGIFVNGKIIGTHSGEHWKYISIIGYLQPKDTNIGTTY